MDVMYGRILENDRPWRDLDVGLDQLDDRAAASIIDPASCGPDEEVQTDARLGVPATVGQLRAVASFAQAKRTAARTSTELLTRNITQTAGRVSAMCEELSAVLTTAP